MVNHEILIKCLHNRFEIRDTALQWIKSYLENRSQKVAIGGLGTDLDVTSKAVTLTLEYPMVAFLGPSCLQYTRYHCDQYARNMVSPTAFMLMTKRYNSLSNL